MRNFFILLIISIGFASCDDNFLSQTLEIDPPPYEKQLVLHGFGNNLDSVFRITLTQNFGILETVPDGAWVVPGATVELLENGQKKANLTQDDPGKAWYTAPVLTDLFVSGNVYEIRASHPDFNTVNTAQMMPFPVQVDSARFRPNAGVDTDGSKLSAVEIFLQDPPGIENFYEIRIAIVDPVLKYIQDANGNYIIDTIGYQEYLIDPVNSEDPNAILTYGSGIAISDRFFDGKAYKFSARMYDYSYGNHQFRVHVRAISEESYLWGVSAQLKYDTEDFPFADPVTTYTNLNNGIGIFGLAHEQVFTVQ